MSRNISWINEIKNNTNQDYIMWCHDTDNEGEFKNSEGKVLGKNNDGRQFVIRAKAHIYASDCGIPDGGDKNNIPKARVICLKSAAKKLHGDPGAGLRLNRTIADDEKGLDRLAYRDHDTTKPIADMIFPKGSEQNIILRIDNDGIFLEVKEAKESSEYKAYLVGENIKKLLTELAPELAKLAIQVAQKTLEYMP